MGFQFCEMCIRIIQEMITFCVIVDLMENLYLCLFACSSFPLLGDIQASSFGVSRVVVFVLNLLSTRKLDAINLPTCGIFNILNWGIDQCCKIRFGLAIGMVYFGTGQYRRFVSDLLYIYIYIYIFTYLYVYSSKPIIC